MSTSGKTSIRKDKFSGISNIFAEQDAANAAFKEQTVAKTNAEQPQKQEEPMETASQSQEIDRTKTTKAKPKKGGGAAEEKIKSSKSGAGIFVQPTKQTGHNKSVYFSRTNLDFVSKQAELHEISFSTVLNQIIDNFRQNF